MQINKFLEQSYYMDGHSKVVLQLLNKKMKLEEQYKKMELESSIQISESDLNEYNRLNKKLNGNADLGAFFVIKEKDKKKLIKDIETIKKKYVNPSFETLYKNIEKKDELLNELQNINENMDVSSSYLFQSIDKMKVILQDENYLDKNQNLTKKGIVGMAINECNELLFGYLIDKYGQNEEITYEMWIALFALFIEDKSKKDEVLLSEYEVPELVKVIVKDLEEMAHNFCNKELSEKLNIGNSYELNYDYMEIMYKWACGATYNETKALSKIEIFDGNFVKAVYRVQNIMDDVKNICKMNEYMDLLCKLENAKVVMIRDIAQINSLYIKM